MNSEQKTLIVRTLSQAVLFECELKGQFSDGNWENATPWEHWKSWSNAKVQIGENVGRNFYPIKDNYGLHVLIKYIGDRMQFMGALAVLYPEETAFIMASEYPGVPDSLSDWSNHIKWAAQEELPGWATRKVGRWENAGLTEEKIEQVERMKNEVYPLKQLRKDLTEIKTAMKTKVIL